MDTMDSPAFPQFNRLPTELRLKIWQHAIPRRTVALRFKQDLNAWNWASEWDWWLSHWIRVDPERPAPELPAVALVNHEARHEVLAAWARAGSALAAFDWATAMAVIPESLIEEMDDTALAAEFGRKTRAVRAVVNPDRDVVEWPEARRWAQAKSSAVRAMFLGACLAVRHVSLEYQWLGNLEFGQLAAAVLDRSRPLQTLTVTAVDRKNRCQFQIRLARKPRNPVVLRDYADLGGALRRHSAVLLPSYGPTPTTPPPTTTENSGTTDEGWQSPHPILNDEIAKISSLRLPSDTRLDSDFAFFLILRQQEVEDSRFVDFLRDGLCTPPERAFEDAGEPEYWRFGKNIQVDIAILMRTMSENSALLGNPLSDPQAVRTSVKPPPCHGFCSSGYGLPDSQEAWDSHCLDNKINWNDYRYRAYQ